MKAVNNLLYPEYAFDEMAADLQLAQMVGSHEPHSDMVQHIGLAT